MMKRTLLLLGLLLALTAVPGQASQLGVVVSVAPLKFFAERIGGDRVDASVMVPAGASPATYEPKPRQMVALTKAQLFVAIGVPFEKAWLPRIQSSNPDLTIVKGITGIELLQMQSHHHDDHGHDDHDGIPDPHVWTSPTASKTLAGVILSALVQADPQGSDFYQKNYEQLLTEIDTLDAELHQMLDGKKDTRFLVYHPSWGYFARDYGLIQMPVELEGKKPGPKELAQIIRMAQENNIKVVFAQPQFSEKSARIVADAIEGRIVEADPLAEDWANNLRRVGKSIRDALR